MKYNYSLTDEFRDEPLEAIKKLGKRQTPGGPPKIVINSHEEMVFLLREASKDLLSINQRAMDAIEKYDRTFFFDWGKNPDTVKERNITPYTFMANVFADNSIAVASLMYAAQYVCSQDKQTNNSILFAFTFGEEVLGDLRGIKSIVDWYEPQDEKIKEVVAIEGAWLDRIVERHIGGKKFELTITCDGGHAWEDRVYPSAEAIYREFVKEFEGYLDASKDALNVGLLNAGTGPSQKAKKATATFDLRSVDQDSLDHLWRVMRLTAKQLESKYQPIHCKIEIAEPFSDRPAATISRDYEGIRRILEIKERLGIPNSFRDGSTDANYPLSLRIPSFTIGTTNGFNLHDAEREFIEITPVRKGTEMLIRYIMTC